MENWLKVMQFQSAKKSQIQAPQKIDLLMWMMREKISQTVMSSTCEDRLTMLAQAVHKVLG